MTKKVFVVHGHEETAKNEIELFLREIGLEPIILHRMPDRGMTLIEKIEHYSDVVYSIILLTPDDTVIGSGKSVNKIKRQEHRSRQNVIFEWGYFVGRFGRDRVCCVYKKGTNLPSDVSGVVYKPYAESVEEVKYALLQELKAAGLAVG